MGAPTTDRDSLRENAVVLAVQFRNGTDANLDPDYIADTIMALVEQMNALERSSGGASAEAAKPYGVGKCGCGKTEPCCDHCLPLSRRAPEPSGKAARFTVQPTRCNCHPETCGCAPWSLFDGDERIAKGFDERQLLAVAHLANRSAPEPVANLEQMRGLYARIAEARREDCDPAVGRFLWSLRKFFPPDPPLSGLSESSPTKDEKHD